MTRDRFVVDLMGCQALVVSANRCPFDSRQRFGKYSLEGDRPTTAATAARNQRRTFGSASQQPGRGQQTAAPEESFRTAFGHLVKDQCTCRTRSTHQITVLPTSQRQFMPQLRSKRAPEDLLPGTSCEMQLLRLFRTFRSGTVNGEHPNSPYAQVLINNTPVFTKLDSGAEVRVVPSTFPGLPTKLEKCDITLTGPVNEPLHVLEKLFATIQWKQRIVRQTVYVVSPLCSIILGLPALDVLELIKFAD
ncbi:hypothetical protein MRX96_005291 [Rhipicephalus microplus]